MKNIDFVFVGLPKHAGFKALEGEYCDKICRYVESDVRYLKDSPEKNADLKRKKESQDILDHLKPSDVVVLCDERGGAFGSILFAKKLATWQASGKRVVMIVGGAYGVSDELRKRATATLKLSDFTLPHELARVVLLEQTYRALTIQAGEKYHHE